MAAADNMYRKKSQASRRGALGQCSFNEISSMVDS